MFTDTMMIGDDELAMAVGGCGSKKKSCHEDEKEPCHKEPCKKTCDKTKSNNGKGNTGTL